MKQKLSENLLSFILGIILTVIIVYFTALFGFGLELENNFHLHHFYIGLGLSIPLLSYTIYQLITNKKIGVITCFLWGIILVLLISELIQVAQYGFIGYLWVS